MNNKSKPKIFLAALAAAAGLASSNPTKGSPVLDANYTPNSSGGNIIVAQRLSVAQTFTVLSTGTMTSAAVNLAAGSPNANLVFEIRTLSGGLPSEATSGPTVLAASVLSPVGLTTSFNWVTFNFTGFDVVAGEQLALVLTSSATAGDYIWNGDTAFLGSPNGTYSSGQAYDEGTSAGHSTWGGISLCSSSCNDPSLVDMSFRTFVAAAVPEPSTWTMMVLGFLGVGFLAYRNKSALRSA